MKPNLIIRFLPARVKLKVESYKKISVMDPFNFDVNPDPRIKKEIVDPAKKKISFFSSHI